MIKSFKITYTFLILAISTLFLSTALTSAQSANEAQFLVSPASGTTLNRNNIVPFTISVNSGDEPINVVSFSIEYNQSDLEFVNTDPTGSKFEFSAPTEPSGNGVVFVTRGTPTEGGVTQTNEVVKVNFRVLNDSGTTELKFGDDSNIIRIGAIDIWNRNTAIGTYNLLPGEAQPQQPVTQGNNDNIVAIKITDQNNNPLPNKVVKIADRSTITDDSGIANFGSIPADNQIVEVFDEDGTKIAEEEIVISDDFTDSTVQQYEIAVDEDSSNSGIILFAIVLVFLAIIAIIFFTKDKLFGKRVKKNEVTNLYSDIDAISNRQYQKTADFPQAQNNTPPAPGESINPTDPNAGQDTRY